MAILCPRFQASQKSYVALLSACGPLAVLGAGISTPDVVEGGCNGFARVLSIQASTGVGGAG